MKAPKLSLYMIAVFSAANLSAQVYYSEDFENLTTETAPGEGWEFGQNETATEDGTEFVIAPPFARAG